MRSWGILPHSEVTRIAGVMSLMSQWGQNHIQFLPERHQFSSVAQSCPTFCDPMNRSTPGLPVHHQLPEFTQTHVHRVGDVIQPSHPLLSPSSPALNLSQNTFTALFFSIQQLVRTLNIAPVCNPEFSMLEPTSNHSKPRY